MKQFKIVDSGSYLVVVCPENMGVDALKEFTELAAEWTKSPGKHIVFDLTDVKAIVSKFYRPIAFLRQGLKRGEKTIYSMCASLPILLQIRNEGLESLFAVKADLKEVMTAMGIRERPKLDVNFINPFIVATKNTFERQANTKVTPGKVQLARPDEVINIEIAGVLSMTTETFEGSIAICFPTKVFLGVYFNMLGEKHEEISEEIEDAAGELLNMIFGQAKSFLNDKVGYKLQKALPTVIRGTELKVRHLQSKHPILIPFETEFGPFQLEISV